MGAKVRAGLRSQLSALARSRGAWAYAGLFALYCALRLFGFLNVDTTVYRDSESYLLVAGKSLLSPDFWAGARPWTVPLLYKLVPGGADAHATAQLVVSIAAWTALAAAVARCLSPRGCALGAFAIVLAFSLSFQIIRWDRLILTESVSISLTAAVTAAWLTLARRPRPLAVVTLLVVNLLWVFTRDSNALLAGVTAIPALAWAVRPGNTDRRWPLLLAGGLLASFAANLAATGTEEAQLRRQDRPILHVVGRRVLVNPEQETYFRAHGMPEPSPRVRQHRKALAAIGETIRSDPATDAFLDWVREDGRRVLARYLITNPRATLRPLVKYRKRLLSGVTVGYTAVGSRLVLPRWLQRTIYPGRVRSVMRWLAVAAGLALIAASLGGARRTWLVPIGFIALQLPHAILVYHGDTLEVARHAVVMAISLRLGVLLLALMALGALVEWAFRARAGPSHPAAPPA